MRSLFGHLCSGDDFSHDKYMREMLDQNESRPSKRVRHASLSMTSSQQSSISYSTDDDGSATGEGLGRDQHVDPDASSTDILPTQQAVSHSYSQDEDTVDRIRSVRDCLEGMKDQMLFTNGPLPAYLRGKHEQAGPEKQQHAREDQDNSQESVMSVSVADPTSRTSCPESQLSVPMSLFESQSQDNSNKNHGKHEQLDLPNTDGPDDLDTEIAPSNNTTADNDNNSNDHNKSPTSSCSSLKNRLRAYHAARAGTFDAWSEVALVSAGNNHTEEEVEL